MHQYELITSISSFDKRGCVCVWVGPVCIPALGTKRQLTEVRQTDYFLKLPLFKENTTMN